MQRPIVGFHLDEHGDWVAELSCGHGQHVRHKPPFWSRPWVLTAEGRAGKLGLPLDCVRCDAFELPAGFAPYKRTPEWTAATLPAGLRRDHTTKPGVWGVIHVVAGRVRYVVEPPLARDAWIAAGQTAIVVPEVAHRVEPDADARLWVEFHRRAA